MSTVLTPNLMCSTLQVAPQFFLTSGVKEGPSPVQGHKTEKAQEVKVNGSQAEATLRLCLSDTRTCIPNRFPLLLKTCRLGIHVCCILWLCTSISMCRGLEGGVPPHGH